MATSKKGDPKKIKLTKKDLERMLKYLDRTGKEEIEINLDDVDASNKQVQGNYCSDVC